MQNDYNPDEPFEGLGILGWFKVIFRTRAQTLRQCDNMTKMLFEKANEARAEADQAAEVVQRLSPLVVIQHRALEMALPVLQGAKVPGMMEWIDAENEVRYAIAQAKEKL